MKIIVALCGALAVAAPLAAQPRKTPPPPVRSAAARPTEPLLSIRGFFMATEQEFAARTTFEAAFGNALQPFWGGGAQIVFRDGAYLEVSVSRFQKTGQRAFVFSGQTFSVGIPLTATDTPVEVSGGYRFRLRKHRNVIPFVGVGFGEYSYTETSSFSAAGDDVDTSHVGVLGDLGVELRVHRLVGLSIDAQVTHVPGILGVAGISQDAGENDLGGIAARFKVIVGR